MEGIESGSVLLRAGESNGQLRMQLHPYGNGSDILRIDVADPAVLFSLVLPDGREVTRKLAERTRFEWEISKLVTWEDFDRVNQIPNLVQHSIRFPPEQPSGEYGIRVDASQLSEWSTVSATFFDGRLAPDLLELDRVNGEATHNKMVYTAGDRPVIELDLRDGLRPLKSASANGRFFPAAGTQVTGEGTPFPFLDDGDSYKAILPALPVGEYIVKYGVAGKRTNGEPFSGDQGSFRFIVAHHCADIIGFAERGIDLDEDGRVEEIEVTAKVRILRPGEYRLKIVVSGDPNADGANLKSHLGKAQRVAFRGRLEAGETSLRLKLNGQDLAQSGREPYHIIHARLTSSDSVKNLRMSSQDSACAPATVFGPRFRLAVLRSQLPE
jgi:hypothetical protein